MNENQCYTFHMTHVQILQQCYHILYIPLAKHSYRYFKLIYRIQFLAPWLCSLVLLETLPIFLNLSPSVASRTGTNINKCICRIIFAYPRSLILWYVIKFTREYINMKHRVQHFCDNITVITCNCYCFICRISINCSLYHTNVFVIQTLF